MTQTTTSALPILTSTVMGELPGIHHGFFGREGGVSGGVFASLNVGLASNDDTTHIAENRRRVAAALGARHFLTLAQVHGPRVITVTESLLDPVGTGWRSEATTRPIEGRSLRGAKEAEPLSANIRTLPEADAMVTNLPGIALGILTADCVPILLADAEAGVIGAAHAGWKGALAGVAQATVNAMAALGARTGHIAAAIGPAIAQESYQVSADFRGQFLQQSAECARYFTTRDGSPYFDIKAYAADALEQAGVERIEVLPHDTYADEIRFFSFRRATHRKESYYGRQVSAIMLRA